MGKQVIIMRGPAGSGKGTWIEKNAPDAVVVSTDHFFMHDEPLPIVGAPIVVSDGKPYAYRFDPRKLGEAHASCMHKFLRALQLRQPFIAVDNTNTHNWEWFNYANAAKLVYYEVRVVAFVPRTIDELKLCAERNTHGVPIEIVAKMCYEYEPSEYDEEFPIIQA